MPFKSKAQINKFFSLVKQGKMSEETVREWMSKTKNISRLPEKVKKKKEKNNA